MRLFAFLLVGFLAWSCVSQTEAGPRRKPRFVGGTPSAPNRWPFMAAIYKNMYADIRFKFTCGAIVWSENTIITAAHCALATDLKDLRVYIGQWNMTEISSKYMYNVEKVVIQEDFDIVSGNIALLRLDRSIDYSNGFVKPVGRAVSPSQVNSKDCVAMGWGDIGDFNFQIQDLLHEVSLKLLSDEQCAQRFELFQMPAGVKCAIDEKETKGVCLGDSGSPIMCPLKSNPSQFAVMGIAISGDSSLCTLGIVTKPSLFTSMEMYQPWIEKTVTSREYNSPMTAHFRLRYLLVRMLFLAKMAKHSEGHRH